MKLFRQMIALLLCAAMIFSLAVSASADGETNSPDSGAAAPVSETNDDPYEQENPGEQDEDTDDEDDEEDADEEEQDEDEEDDEKLPPELDLHAQQVSVSVGAKIQLKAEPKNFESTPSGIAWSSENPGIATVDGRGTVTGKATGKTTITVTAMDGETAVSASCVVCVTARNAFFRFLLGIGYSYNSTGDYFYSDNNSAWQRPFGFIRLYDTASQLIGYQYDFTRMVFTYGNKDWLIEFWKGQYGLFQMGGEIGIYTKYSVGFGDTLLSAYRCAPKEDWLNMEMTLYHKMPDGSIRREFTREYGKYWWCDGYRVGQLNKSKPATELQMVSRITLKDEKMAAAFANSMKTAGFKEVSELDILRDDTFFRDGSDVYFIWRNLTESQALVPITINGETVGAFQLIVAGFGLLIQSFSGIFGSLIRRS